MIKLLDKEEVLQDFVEVYELGCKEELLGGIHEEEILADIRDLAIDLTGAEDIGVDEVKRFVSEMTRYIILLDYIAGKS